MSRLFKRMMTPCVMRVYTDTPDGEGGNTAVWDDGAPFDAAIVKNSDLAAKLAEKDTAAATYTITTAHDLSFHDVFKRVSDGALFRVTSQSDDSAPPAEASFSFRQATAERWEEASA